MMRNIKFFALTLCLATLSGGTHADVLKQFSSDGCSAFPDGTIVQNDLWLECCTAHDFAYWKGGSHKQRKNADKELRNCVTAVGKKTIALVILAGVTVGGSPLFPTKFRWGYGWSGY